MNLVAIEKSVIADIISTSNKSDNILNNAHN